MRKYYLFEINKDFYELYKNNENSLYKLLYNIYMLDKNDLNYGISLYKQLCEKFDVVKLKNYLQNKKNMVNKKNKYLFMSKNCYEKTLMQIQSSVVILLTNVNFPCILKVLNYYSNHIFICDFHNNDYFWLNNR